MKKLIVAACGLVLASAILAQSDRGTITGTVSDPAGAVVAAAPVQIKNVETGAVYQAGTSATGNYTLAQLPAGQYELSVSVPGFKNFVRKSITVNVAETYRVDVVLEVGSNTESVTVTEAAPLLKTESGELSHTVSTNTMNNLPVMSIGAAAGSSGIRNPYSVVQLLPGTTYSPDVAIRVNGLPANTQAMRIEGQDATNGWYSAQSQTQGSVDAMQEFAVQTSNYAAELGQAGGGLFNVTMRSGTNQFHGGAFEYFVNDALNAGTPFTNDGKGQLLRPRQRRNDWGFSLGGPVLIPKLFNGHDKAFFFFNFEHFGETTVTNNVSTTVPTPAYRNGDFSSALTGRTLITDPVLGAVKENTIYDPTSDFVVGGLRYRNPFPNNVIPPTSLDPVALKIQNLIPLPLGPNANGSVNNYLPTYSNPKYTLIPSVKADYQIGPKSKISGFWSLNRQDNPNNGLMPKPIRSSQPRLVNSSTYRLNFEQTLTPTLLLHFGAGIVTTRINDHSDRFDSAAQLGLTGTYSTLFPVFTIGAGNQGGMAAGMGPGNQIHLIYRKPTGNTSLTWVHNNHTFKFGGETMVDGYQMFQETYTDGWLTYSANETSVPALNGVSLGGGTVGYSYASFLLGAVDNGFNAVPVTNHMGAHSLSGFAQDSWKVTRKLTLDYGLRYDFSTYLQDGHGYYLIWSPSTANPNAGGRPGAIIGEGYGGGRCNCMYSKNYPFAFGPRLGLAYQVTSKTVLRVGAGVSYYKTDNNNLGLSSVSQFQYQTASFGDPAYLTRNGLPYKLIFPNFNPGQGLSPGLLGSAPQEQDQNAGRPARQIQWSVGVQREIARNMIVEATYVGNRGAWWNAAGLICTNCITPATLAKYGLDLNNSADRTLLASAVSSPLAISRGFGFPYPGFPPLSTVAQSLRPYPQYPNITNWHWVPDGDTWYESLQVKTTKRLSHGLEFSSAFTWAKQLTSGVEDDFGRGGGVIVNDAFNRPNQKALSSYDQPFQFVISGSYTTPKWSAGGAGMKALSWISRDWQIGTLLRYASGLPIASPPSTNSLVSYLFQTGAGAGAGAAAGAASQSTLFNRVPGVPLFTQDLNCHCFDPHTTFVLNPAAWSNPGPGQWGTAAAYYSDFRFQRRPVENISLGRVFRVKERASLQIRAEFTNMFNRTEMNNPVAANPLATLSRDSNGQTLSGYGYINVGTVFSAARQGQLVARFQF
ncbi:MAG TPA: TonB-dependent receptor [Bryobacteraceae bacterium]|nr:TonB-dependent receptor [Bryobacteraceae bacterium]